MTEVHIREATEDDKGTLTNLFELYTYDFSELMELDVDDEGRFEARSFDAYWEEPWRHPFLIHVDQRLAASLTDAATMGDVFRRAAETLVAHERDVPFVLFYVRDEEARVMRLAASVGVAAGTAATPEVIPLREGSPFCVDEVVRTGRAVRVDGLRETFGTLVCGPYPEPPDVAMVLPVTPPGHAAPAAVLVAGASSRLPLDELYQSFEELLAATVTSGVANARAREEERRRADALAEIDRAKTAFFSNISHEFRTPLTLMLAPEEDALASPQGVLAGEDLRAVHRNTLRLLKLVNSLLDFYAHGSGPRTCIPCLNPRYRRASRRDADSRAWRRVQLGDDCCSAGGGGTVTWPTAFASSSATRAARVRAQYFGASSKYRSLGQ